MNQLVTSTDGGNAASQLERWLPSFTDRQQAGSYNYLIGSSELAARMQFEVDRCARPSRPRAPEKAVRDPA
ncbi:hypothetical protein [Pseudomonas sp. PL-6]